MHIVADGEQVLAEQFVLLPDRHAVSVRISEDRIEGFWRLDVTEPGGSPGHLTTTLAPGASFMMTLIGDALGGDALAWRHLAEWGRTNLLRQPA